MTQGTQNSQAQYKCREAKKKKKKDSIQSKLRNANKKNEA